MYQNSRIIIHNDTAYIEPTIRYLSSVGELVGLNQSEIHRICYAVEETLSNSILFDFEEGSVEEIEVAAVRVASGLKVTISDHGLPRDPFMQMPGSLEEIASEVSFDSITKSSADEIESLSSFVIHKLLDRYSTINRGKKGRSVEMTIFASEGRYSEEPIETKESIGIKETGTTREPVETKEPEQARGSFSCIRPACAADAVSISRLFYKSYDYSYVYDLVYYPERLAEALKSQMIQSFIALSDEEETIGHIALMDPYENAEVIEWGMAISDPKFRGQGIMSRMIEKIMNAPSLSNYEGLFAHSVTNHEFTQKICAAHGFSDVALLVGYASADISFKNIHNTLSQRESTIISYKPLKPIESAPLFLPEKHEGIIKKLYRGLGVEIIPKSITSTDKPPQNSVIKETILSSVNVAEIMIESAGEEITQRIKKSTKKLCISRVDILYLIINLEDATAVAHINSFEEEGYIFAGIFPHYRHKHPLIMQYFNNLKFDYTLIKAYTPLAEELKKINTYERSST